MCFNYLNNGSFFDMTAYPGQNVMSTSLDTFKNAEMAFVVTYSLHVPP